MEADDVGAAEQLLERIVSAGEGSLRPEGLRQARRLPADPAGADDAERLAVEALSEHEFERERPLGAGSDEPVSLDDPAEESERDGDCELGSRPRQHVRCVRDHDAPAPRRLQVDVVDAHGVVGHHLELWAGVLQIRVVDRGRDEGQDALRIRRVGDELEVLFESLRHAPRHLARHVYPPLSSQVHLRGILPLRPALGPALSPRQRRPRPSHIE